MVRYPKKYIGSHVPSPTGSQVNLPINYEPSEGESSAATPSSIRRLIHPSSQIPVNCPSPSWSDIQRLLVQARLEEEASIRKRQQHEAALAAFEAGTYLSNEGVFSHFEATKEAEVIAKASQEPVAGTPTNPIYSSHSSLMGTGPLYHGPMGTCHGQ